MLITGLVIGMMSYEEIQVDIQKRDFCTNAENQEEPSKPLAEEPLTVDGFGSGRDSVLFKGVVLYP